MSSIGPDTHGFDFNLNYAHDQPPEHLPRAVDVARV